MYRKCSFRYCARGKSSVLTVTLGIGAPRCVSFVALYGSRRAMVSVLIYTIVHNHAAREYDVIEWREIQHPRIFSQDNQVESDVLSPPNLAACRSFSCLFHSFKNECSACKETI
jgi:hypothetical protein